MGLFSRKKPASRDVPPAAEPSSEQSATPPPPAESSKLSPTLPDINDRFKVLADACRETQTPESYHSFWKAFFALESWNFSVDKASGLKSIESNSPAAPPLLGFRDTRTNTYHIGVWTSAERVSHYGVTSGAYSENDGGMVLGLSRDNALSMLAVKDGGVTGIYVNYNYEEFTLVLTIDQLLHNAMHYLGTLPAGTWDRFTASLQRDNTPNAYTFLFQSTFRLGEWFVAVNKNDPEKPILMRGGDNGMFMVVYTHKELARDAIENGAEVEAAPGAAVEQDSVRLTPGRAIEMLGRANADLNGAVQGIVFNMGTRAYAMNNEALAHFNEWWNQAKPE